MSKPNWVKIRNEYVSGDISQRDLAKKYNVGYQTLRDRANKEKWFDRRKEQRKKIGAKIEQKTAEKIATLEANRMARINAAADRLLEKIEEATEQLDQFIVTNRIKQKEVEYVGSKAGFGKPKKEVVKEVEDKRVINAGYLDKAGLKQLTSALKDLKDIQFVKDEEKPQESPNISITIAAATPDDMEVDED